MKELGEVTFMKEWVKAPSVGVVLPLTHLQNLVSFPRYGRLKKKCWYKQVCNGTYWLLLTAFFGPVFIRPSQWRITAVRGQLLVTWVLICITYSSASLFLQHCVKADLVKATLKFVAQGANIVGKSKHFSPVSRLDIHPSGLI